MNARRRKTVVSRLFSARFKGPPLWYSGEGLAWDNMVPVGREFGSPDYERLMREDCENHSGVFSVSLQKAVSEHPDSRLLSPREP